jgi:hypothetical protein
MNISEIIEGIKNTGILLDIIRGNQILAREIRQTYNKVIRGKCRTPSTKLFTKNWAEYIKNNTEVQLNSQLVEMLEEIIKYCSE